MTAVPAPGMPSTPLWRLAARSFWSGPKQAVADRVICQLPIALVLLVQAMAGLRLNNSAFQDEALYIYTGHWVLDSWVNGGSVYSHPETFFSGAPQLYPVFAALLDSLGGLGLVRAFSTLCMLSATVAVYWVSNVLFAEERGRRVGVMAAAVFATSASVVYLSNFATFDAPSFTCLTWAMAVGVWSAVRRRHLLWAPLVGALCAAAVLLKYASAIDVPFVLLIALIAGWTGPGPRGRVMLQGFLAGLSALTILAGSLLTWARPLLEGLAFTTTERTSMAAASPGSLAWSVISWDGLPLLTAAIGGVVLLWTRPVLALVLLAGTMTAPAYQIAMGESVSLTKHVALGLLLGAPLAGYALARLSARRFGAVLAAGALWLSLMQGLVQSGNMYSGWSNTDALARELRFSIDAMPWIRVLGDSPETMQYAFGEVTQPWQWTATYDGSFFYKDLRDIDAYERALQDNYFQLVFLDGAYPISRALIPKMEQFGFTLTSTVKTPYVGHQWMIWQRFDDIPE